MPPVRDAADELTFAQHWAALRRVRQIRDELDSLSRSDWRRPLWDAAEKAGAIDDDELQVGFHAAERIYEAAEADFESELADVHARAYRDACMDGADLDDAGERADEAVIDASYDRSADFRYTATQNAVRASRDAILRYRRERAVHAWAPQSYIRATCDRSAVRRRQLVRPRARAREVRRRRARTGSRGSPSRRADPEPHLTRAAA